jgi:hypothetical protein
VNGATESVLAGHAATLLSLAEMYAASGEGAVFARVAASWPYPGEDELSPEDVVLGAARFGQQLRQAGRRVRDVVVSTSEGMEA